MSVTTATYTARITSEHNQQPDYMAMVALTTQGAVDTQNLLAAMTSTFFDLDSAVGQQEDFLGQWVGASRILKKPLPVTGSKLNDNDYRTLLYAVIAENYWDGTVPDMYVVWAVAFPGAVIYVVDKQDMTMAVVFLNPAFTTVQLALLTNGYFDLRPAGVGYLGYFQPSGEPIFALDIENANFQGLDQGYLIVPLVV